MSGYRPSEAFTASANVYRDCLSPRVAEEAAMPAREEMPSTIRRSPKKAQETWAKTHDAAVETYGEGERSHRTAFSALKHSFEKVGDHWEPKQRKGPSDEQAERSYGDKPAP